jgi:D-inositol-3-phosphate glycosyltransferase
MTKPRLLWIGDACWSSGFARVTHNVLAYLSREWDVAVLGIGATGDPHPYPYRIWPSKTRLTGDNEGFSRLAEVCAAERPDVVLINSDACIVGEFLKRAKDLKERPLFAAYVPVDSPGFKRMYAEKLSELDMLFAYTDFGLSELAAQGYRGRCAVVPHGIDRRLYRPVDQAKARARIMGDLPENAFLIGNVNRNQPHKRLDLTLMYFAEWIRRGGDGYLYFHCALCDVGWDLVELRNQLGMEKRVLFAPAFQTIKDAPDESFLPLIYSSLDLYVSTTIREGWGLTPMEAMACGVPVVAPDWAALAEWARPAARLVPCTSLQAIDGYHTFGIGGVVDREAWIQAVDEMARSPELRADHSRRGLELMADDRFDWRTIAGQFHAGLLDLIREKRPVKAVA